MKYFFQYRTGGRIELTERQFYDSIEKGTGLDCTIASIALDNNGSIEHPEGKWITERE